MNKKQVYIIGGPNGAGKTTFVEKYLPKYLHVENFVNADAIAKGLSPFNYALMQIKAGKIMLELIRELKAKELSFGFETTLAGKKWISLIKELKSKGYIIHIFFLDIPIVDMAIQRVDSRIQMGGHSIPRDTISRRFKRSKNNFWNMYKDIADYWYLFDSSSEVPRLIADSTIVINKEFLKIFKEGISKL